jgi:AraC-like DNA-binding protein
VQAKAATPIGFVHAVAEAYRLRGLDPRAALQQAQIAPALLKRGDARITAAQMEALCAAAMRELYDEALGWFSRRLPWGSYGMLACASLSAADLGVALKRWCRHHGLLTDDITIQLETAGAVAALVIQEHLAFRARGTMRELCLVSTLRNVHGYACWLIDSRIAMRALDFSFAAPAHRAAYDVLFPAPVRFDAPCARLSFDAMYLALPVRRDERAMQVMLQNALPLPVRLYRRDRLLVQRVRDLLREPVRATATAEQLAQALHVSVRTLHRQLQEQGATLQALKDETRRARAIELLCRSSRPIKQIAAAVGFSNEKSFARAFRHWTGVSPSAYRNRAGAATPA